MFKRLSLAVLVCAGSLSIFAIASGIAGHPSIYQSNSVCTASPGMLDCGSGIVKSVPSGSYGMTSLNGTEVTGALQDIKTGSFLAKNAKLDDQVNFTAGQASFTSTTLMGEVNFTAGQANFISTKLMGDVNLISGMVSFSQSTLQHSINLSSQKVVFNTSNLMGNLTIQQSQSTPVLTLKNHSHISGNIVFSSLPGTVCVDGSSSFSGQLMNGSLAC